MDSRFSHDMAMAHAKADADYTDQELLEHAVKYHRTDPGIAWQYREAWAIRCVEGVREEADGEDRD